MKKTLGILGLLVFVFAATATAEPMFLSAYNIQNLVRWTALFGIISIGVAFPIITGGIDLSIGSVISLVGSLMAWLMVERGWSVGAGLAAVLALSLAIGLAHGLLITKMRLPAFVVTLCGLLIYRGAARWLLADQTIGFGMRYEALRALAIGRVPLPLVGGFSVPIPFLLMVGIAIGAAVFLNRTIWGRYLLALGRNEEAARFSGVNTDRMIVVAYVISACLAGVGGILFSLDVNSIAPAVHGNFYELYAIAAAVLGGCSLRGGEGSILGVVIGAAVMRVLYNSINLLRIPTQLELAIIGGVILAGVMADELVKRFVARRRGWQPEAQRGRSTGLAG